MSGWWIAGFVCVGLVLAAVAFIAWASIAADREEKHYREHGEEVLGWIVQANTDLYESGNVMKPAQVFFSFDRSIPDPGGYFTDLARRAARLKGKSPKDPAEAEVAELVSDESYRPFERDELPREFTGGREVYSGHIMILRGKLPGSRLQHPYVRLLVLRDEPDKRMLMADYTPDELAAAEE